MYLLPLITITIYFYLINISYQEKLIFATTHFRHGARAPISINQNNLDDIKEKWTNPGELTASGMRMQYLMGLRNRKRYIEDYKLLSPTFDPHEILVYSTNYNRTLMSAYSQLQGLYPSKPEVGLSLTDEQEISAVPQVDISDSYVQDEIEVMNSSALPNFMTVIPIRMINDNEKKINLDRCGSNENSKNVSMDSIIAVKYYFNVKYKNYLNKLFGYESSNTYNFSYMNSLCDAFTSCYTDSREITELKNTGINFEDFINYCYEVQKLYFRDYLLNSGNNIFDRLESSKLLREMIRLIKQRVDIDINNITQIEYDDFSKPKMMMISAHDTTVSCHEMTIINCFNLNINSFKLPKYASQIAFEVTRKDDNETENINLSYSDYTVNYYFNDEKMLSVNLVDFIEKLENYLWTEEEVNNFCVDNNNSSSGNNTDNITNDDNKDDKILFFGIIVSALAVVLIALVILFIILIVMYKGIKNGGSGKGISLVGVSKNNTE